jgi:hypothetical protein
MTRRPGIRGAAWSLWAVVLLAGYGCTSSEGRPGWGDRALWPIDGHRIITAATDALLDPQTWVPAAGALIFTIDNWDRRVSDWASERTPVYGSRQNAIRASDDLREPLEIEVPITALATPSGGDPATWALAKTRGLAVEGGAALANYESTEWIKGETDRLRPNRIDRLSLPSAHASSSFTYATLSNRNLDSIDLPPPARTAGQVANLTLAGAVSWARVEGKMHFPSDILAGAALGHFLSVFIYDSLMNLPEDRTVDIAIVPVGDAAALQMAFRF